MPPVNLVRYQVFVSSTLNDLVEERKAIIHALQKLNCIPVAMELFPASSDDAWTLIKREIDNSDYYIVMSAGCYGSMEPSSGVGYTEMEYDYALAAGKGILGFIHSNIASLPEDKKDNEPTRILKLNRFQEKIKQKLVNFWDTTQQLESAVITSCVSEFNLRPAEGWVRARQARRLEDIAQSAEYRGLVSLSSGSGREQAFQAIRERAVQRLLILGIGMTRLSKYARHSLLKRAQHVSIDLLMFNPEVLEKGGSFAKDIERFLDIPDFSRTLRISFDSLRDMAIEWNSHPDHHHRIQLRTYSTIPSSSAVLIDPDLPSGEIVIEFLLYRSGENRPRFHFRKTDVRDGVFQHVSDQVQDLWDSAQKVVG